MNSVRLEKEDLKIGMFIKEGSIRHIKNIVVCINCLSTDEIEGEILYISDTMNSEVREVWESYKSVSIIENLEPKDMQEVLDRKSNDPFKDVILTNEDLVFGKYITSSMISETHNLAVLLLDNKVPYLVYGNILGVANIGTNYNFEHIWKKYKDSFIIYSPSNRRRR